MRIEKTYIKINQEDYKNRMSKKNINHNNMEETIKYKDYKDQQSFQAKLDVQEYRQVELMKKFKSPKKKYLTEWITKDMKIKPFYDLDYEPQNETVYNECIKNVKEQWIEKLNRLFPGCDLSIAESHGKKTKKGKLVYAVSYHIVVNGYETTIHEMKKFNEINNIYDDEGCDKSVYRNAGLFRMINSSKPGECRPFNPVTNGDRLESHIIQSNSWTNTGFNKIDISPPVTPVHSAGEEIEVQSEDDEWGVITNDTEYTIDEYEKVRLAVLQLNPQRASNYADWLNVGIALYNNGDNLDNKNCEIFDEFSKQDEEKYDRTTVMNKWYSFSPRDDALKIGSIFYWLKQDNPEQHKIITKTSTNKYEEWYMKGIDCLVENMNLELMHTKNNEYIQLDHNTHFITCKKDIVDEYAKYTFKVKTNEKTDTYKEINPVVVWIKNINRRDIIGLKFDPAMVKDSNYYNLYKGFEFDLTDDNDYSDIQAYLFHIKDVWANGDEETYEYLLNWFAHIFQKPYKRTDVAIVIPSETEGNGKNIVMNVIRKIMGRMYYSTADINSIVGNFNPQAEGRLLINLNECTWAGRKSQTGILKALVTEDTMNINQKNIKTYIIDNYTNVIIFSNDDNPIEIGKNNRRYYVLDIKEQKLDPSLVDGVLNVDPQKVFNYFMNRDISQFNPTKFKTTSREIGIKEFTYGSDFDFWQEALTENWFSFESYDYSWDELECVKYTLPKSHLFGAYHKQTYGYKQKMAKNTFFKEIKKIFPGVALVNANKSNPPRIRLNDLNTMKQQFNEYFKSEYFTIQTKEVGCE